VNWWLRRTSFGSYRGLAAGANSSQKVNAPMYGGMNVELTEDETESLTRRLRRAIDDDRYPLSLRVQTWKAILGKREPLPPYEPPSRGRYRGRNR